MLFPLFFVGVYLSHISLLRLPYFWDEAGYYVPAALDFFRTGSLVPRSTISSGHPPLPSILLAGWWELSGFVVSGTRTAVALVSAGALLAVFRLARGLLGTGAAATVVVLTAVYPVWFAQSTLANADMFAALFSLWGLSVYLVPGGVRGRAWWLAGIFSLAVLSKETAIGTPVALAGLEVWLWWRLGEGRGRPVLVGALLFPVVPLLGWYWFHYLELGYVFGNPEFLRYNASANLDPVRFALALWHRGLHLFLHMNMFVPVLCAAAAVLTDRRRDGPEGLPRRVLLAIGVVLLANWVEFSVLGGALLTRYLLPMFSLILLVCVAVWRSHLRMWWAVGAFSFAAFVAALVINPPYAFAPEDNLTYRDYVVLHQAAAGVIGRRFPGARVLTAWPATDELGRAELGYVRAPLRTVWIENFSAEQIRMAGRRSEEFDTALVFSTKAAPPAGATDVGGGHRASDERYFDFHRDLGPAEVAAALGGEVVWEGTRKSEWAAVVRFPRAATGAGVGAGGGDMGGR